MSSHKRTTSKRKSHNLTRRKVRRQENNFNEETAPTTDKTIGKASRRKYGVGQASE